MTVTKHFLVKNVALNTTSYHELPLRPQWGEASTGKRGLRKGESYEFSKEESYSIISNIDVVRNRHFDSDRC